MVLCLYIWLVFTYLQVPHPSLHPLIDNDKIIQTYKNPLTDSKTQFDNIWCDTLSWGYGVYLFVQVTAYKLRLPSLLHTRYELGIERWKASGSPPQHSLCSINLWKLELAPWALVEPISSWSKKLATLIQGSEANFSVLADVEIIAYNMIAVIHCKVQSILFQKIKFPQCAIVKSGL